MNDDGLDALRAAVEQCTRAARTQPLTRLGQALANRYWQIGPGSPAAQPYLDEAIQVIGEAYGHLESGQIPRGMQAGLLGWLLGARHVAHGSPVADRERGIVLLDEALGFPQLPQMLQQLCRLVLGQLLLSRVTAGMRSGDFALQTLRSGLSGEEKASADRAVACFREVVDAPAPGADITSSARTMLGLAETLQTLAGGLGGGPAGLDLGRMMQAFTGLQDLQQQAAASPPGVGYGRVPNPFDFVADDLAALDPLARPVSVIEGAVPSAAAAPLEGKPAAGWDRPSAALQVPASTYRTAFLGKLRRTGLAAVLELLDDGPAEPDVETVDEVVALASALVGAPDAVGTDHLLLAVALYLRSVVDAGGGWGRDSEDVDDVRAARESLLAAADAIAAESADAVTVAFRLATLLDSRHPAGGACAQLYERFTGVTKALRAVGADGLLYLAAGQKLLLSAETGYLSPAGSSPPTRILVAGDGRIPDGLTVSHVRSGAQVIDLAGRTRRPLTEAAVFVANPRRDRQQASMDALLLRRTFYPRSTGLGETVEIVDGDGTPDEVGTRLDASMLHLGCGVTADGALELAGPAVLGPAEIAAGPPAALGGLAVLPPVATGTTALTEALLASRFTGVVRFRDTLPDDVASLVYLVLHSRLIDAGSDPASAVAAVCSWLADPHRVPPDYLPTWLDARVSDPDLADPTYRHALVYHGV
jgi:hypothetical protein